MVVNHNIPQPVNTFLPPHAKTETEIICVTMFYSFLKNYSTSESIILREAFYYIFKLCKFNVNLCFMLEKRTQTLRTEKMLLPSAFQLMKHTTTIQRVFSINIIKRTYHLPTQLSSVPHQIQSVLQHASKNSDCHVPISNYTHLTPLT